VKLLTSRDEIRGIAKTWREKYYPFKYDHSRQIYEKLCALNVDTATAKDVDDIIDGYGWTTFRCDECNASKLTEVVQVGQEPDYESATANLCRECLTKAFKLLP